VGALIFDGSRILLVERGKEPLKGYWSLPGGVLETGETLKEGIRREVLEETGLQVDPYDVAEIFERIMRDAQGRAEYHYVLVDFLCRVEGGVPSPADDVSALQWVEVGRLRELLLTEGTLDVIERVYARLS
jgi:ADP-ribose pyrophosphatase YjhB (NUDIX family)